VHGTERDKAEVLAVCGIAKAPTGIAGSARFAQEARDRARKQERKQEIERRRCEFDRWRRRIEAKVEEHPANEESDRDIQIAADRSAMMRSRRADAGDGPERIGTIFETDAFAPGELQP
jgi:hypothetical protein